MSMWEPKRPRCNSGGTPTLSDTAEDGKEKLEGGSFQTTAEADKNRGGGTSSQAKGDEEQMEGVSPPVPEQEEANEDLDAEVVAGRSATDIGYNPMMNPVILDGLMGVCQLKDLRRFRLVCKLWFEVSLTRWRSGMIVPIVKPSKVKRSALSWKNLELDLLYKDPDIQAKPFRRFRMKEYEFPTTQVGRRPAFLRSCGPWIHHLEIISPTIHYVSLFYKFIFEQAPNLKSLKLLDTPDHVFVDWDEDKPKKPHLGLESLTYTLDSIDDSFNENVDANTCIPFHELFKYFPNIKNLTLECNYHGENDTLAEAMEEVFNLQNKGDEERKLNIIYKGMSTFFDDPTAIVDKKLIKLPSISISNLDLSLDSVLDENFLSEVFKLHQTTLTILKLRRDQGGKIPNPPRNPFQSTHLFLTRLHLWKNVVENFHFLEATPNLTQLHFKEIHLRNALNKTDLGIMERKVQLENVKELKVLPIRTVEESQDFSEAEMKMIVTCMPNAKKFVGPLTNDSFRVVCENWKELKSLQITYSTNPINDSGITGIGVQLEDEEEERRMPNLTDLKYLYKFGTDSSLLSDDSVWNGFLKLEYLHALKVNFADKTSNEAFSAAFDKCPSISVTRASSTCKEKRKLNWQLERKAANLFHDFGIK